MIRIIALIANIVMFAGFTFMFTASGKHGNDAYELFMVALVFIVPIINIIALWPCKKRVGEHEGKE